jgi:hypothetical protein
MMILIPMLKYDLTLKIFSNVKKCLQCSAVDSYSKTAYIGPPKNKSVFTRKLKEINEKWFSLKKVFIINWTTRFLFALLRKKAYLKKGF